MKLKNLFADEDAVSPVIGVILMVAITVILAAVIGAFVLGIGGSQEQVPQASWQWEESSITGATACDPASGATGNDVSVTHQGGDEIDASNLQLASNDCNSATVSAGSSLTTSDAPSSGNTVSLVWVSPSSDSTNIIADYEMS